MIALTFPRSLSVVIACVGVLPLGVMANAEPAGTPPATANGEPTAPAQSRSARPEGPRVDTPPAPARPLAPSTLTPSSAPPTPTGSSAPLPGLVRRADGGYDYVDPHGQFTARFYSDGTMAFADPWRRISPKDRDNGRCCALPPAGLGAINPFMGISMSGPVEWLLAIQGKDPLMNAKTDLLAETRELRIALAVEWARKQLATRFAQLDAELTATWNDHARSVAARRELLFRRWDDCDEVFNVRPGDVPPEAVSAIDNERLQTATAARRKIEAFIRQHIPRGSTAAYGDDELMRLNASRVSHEPFAPYSPR